MRVLGFNIRDIFARSFYYELKFKVKCFFYSPHRWLYKVVPRTTYKDKYQIIEDVLYGSIVDFVEKEKCFDHIDWEYEESHRRVGEFIKDCYKWIKVNRPEIQNAIDKIQEDAWKKAFSGNLKEEMNYYRLSYEEKYPGLNELERNIKEKDNYYLEHIVKYREYFWV